MGVSLGIGTLVILLSTLLYIRRVKKNHKNLNQGTEVTVPSETVTGIQREKKERKGLTNVENNVTKSTGKTWKRPSGVKSNKPISDNESSPNEEKLEDERLQNLYSEWKDIRNANTKTPEIKKVEEANTSTKEKKNIEIPIPDITSDINNGKTGETKQNKVIETDKWENFGKIDLPGTEQKDFTSSGQRKSEI